MSEQLYTSLVDLPAAEVEGLEFKAWPVDELNSLAFDSVPEGRRLHISGGEILKYVVSKDLVGLDNSQGVTSLTGYFRGYLGLRLPVQSQEDREVLGLRIDTPQSDVWYALTDSISEILDDETDLEMLFFDDNQIAE